MFDLWLLIGVLVDVESILLRKRFFDEFLEDLCFVKFCKVLGY